MLWRSRGAQRGAGKSREERKERVTFKPRKTIVKKKNHFSTVQMGF